MRVHVGIGEEGVATKTASAGVVRKKSGEE